jgi:hypothetical protein
MRGPESRRWAGRNGRSGACPIRSSSKLPPPASDRGSVGCGGRPKPRRTSRWAQASSRCSHRNRLRVLFACDVAARLLRCRVAGPSARLAERSVRLYRLASKTLPRTALARDTARGVAESCRDYRAGALGGAVVVCISRGWRRSRDSRHHVARLQERSRRLSWATAPVYSSSSERDTRRAISRGERGGRAIVTSATWRRSTSSRTMRRREGEL